MKFYYAASIWGAQGDPQFNLDVINYLKRYGKVLSEHLFLPDYSKNEKLSICEIHDRDINWINESDRIVAEVSAPSLGVGYEIREGVIRKKPVLVLWRKQESKRLSAMISGSPGVIVCEYLDLNDVKRGIDSFLKN